MPRPAHSPIAGQRATALRRRLTVSEARLWAAIRRSKRGARFRRQVPIGPWIVDFASFAPRLVIEVDDSSHEFRDETVRTAYLQAHGFAVLRVTNRQVAMELTEVVSTIEHWVEQLTAHGQPPQDRG